MWKRISYKKYAFNYEINKKGKIRSVKKKKLITLHMKNSGYLFANLYNKFTKKKEAIYVHRLVAYEFIKNPLILPQVNHINCIKTDNRVTNLQWYTRSTNMRHAFDNGLVNIKKGEDHCNNKYSEDDIKRVCFMLERKVKPKDISFLTGVSVYTIKSIKNKYNWKHISCNYDI